MITILHLSDIHLGTENDAKVYLCQLESDLKNELEIHTLDYLVVSGDIADQSTPEDYRAAFLLMDGIIKGFSVKNQHVVIVPGNHDLNWGLSKKAYQFVYHDDAPKPLPEGKYFNEGEAGILLRNETSYQKRFDNFAEHFYKKIHGDSYLAHYEKQSILYIEPDDHLLFLALNSCWEIDHHFKGRSGIHAVSLANAIEKIIGDNYKEYLKIAICHHPVSGPDMMKNVEFMEQLTVNGFKVLMHGHIHEARERFFYRYDDNRGVHIVGAGTFGAPAKDQVSGIPLQYNLLKYEPEMQRIIVETRKKDKPHGAWSADARWGDRNNPKPRYAIDLKIQKKSTDTHAPVIQKPVKIPDIYVKWLIDHCQYMDIDRLREKGKVIQIRLPETFIPLYAHPPVDKTKVRDKMAKPFDEKESAADIERVIFENDYLLIEGLAGSGKTTLMKHFSYTMIQERSIKDRNEWLPILVFLKDLKDCGGMEEGLPANASTAEKILSRYFEWTGNGLDMDLVKGFCSEGRAIFLFDGLDEIRHELRDLIAKSFAEFRNRHECCKAVFSGRPHGFDGPLIDRFGDKHVKILPLNIEQVEAFIKKWFRFYYEEESIIGRKTAEDMIGEVRDHPGIDRLIDNPLMLTAICILYLDGKELPGQRAELYKKFIDNLLYRRFGNESEKVRNFLNSLAFSMQTTGNRGIDRMPAIKILGAVYKSQEDESDDKYRDRLETLFNRIEPDCGLLKLEDGQYNFRHLTFQEFLTATALVDKETDYSKAIQDYWDDERYKEVIELYIGYLSIENKRWANRIIEEILGKKDKKSFYRWRLASRSLIDIHKDRREEAVLNRARECLISIFDTDIDPKSRADAGEILGWLGDPRDLKEFVWIEGGKYNLSTGKVKMKTFEIGRYPVTNQWFEEFIKDGGYENDAYWSDEGRKWLAYTGAKCPRFWHDRQWKCPNAPIVGLCWYEADAFTKWLTKKQNDGHEYMLPDEEEWEAAAAGFEGRIYPWEGGWDSNKCNSDESGIKKTSPVGIFKGSATPQGIFDLAGNVWEWTRSDYHPKKNRDDFTFDEEMQSLIDKQELDVYIEKLREKSRQLPVLRGGSWGNKPYNVRCAYRSGFSPNIRLNNIGFRCARKI